ncbi:MAG: response regulator [Pseudomonadota bacterium]
MAVFLKKALTQIEAGEAQVAPARASVMVVDDREPNLAVMAGILRPHFNVLEARSGQEALATISALNGSERLACIISDYRMPGMTGTELLERIKPLLPWTTRVIVSGYIDLDAIIDAVNRSGISKFIAKPFDADEFLSAISGAVDAFELTSARAARLAELEALVAKANLR